jgi:hypothetical protein
MMFAIILIKLILNASTLLADTTHYSDIVNIYQIDQTACIEIRNKNNNTFMLERENSSGNLEEIWTNLNDYPETRWDFYNIADLCVPPGRITYYLILWHGEDSWDPEVGKENAMDYYKTDFSKSNSDCSAQSVLKCGEDAILENRQNTEWNISDENINQDSNCGGCSAVSADPSAPLASGMAIVGLFFLLAARWRKR